MPACDLILLSTKFGTFYRYALGGTKLALNSKVAWMVGAFQRMGSHKRYMCWVRCAYHLHVIAHCCSGALLQLSEIAHTS